MQKPLNSRSSIVRYKAPNPSVKRDRLPACRLQTAPSLQRYLVDQITIIDDSPEKIQRQPKNHIHVKPYLGSPTDSELLVVQAALAAFSPRASQLGQNVPNPSLKRARVRPLTQA